jgi:hypothetical protein
MGVCVVHKPTATLALVDRETGRARTMVMHNVSAATLMPIEARPDASEVMGEVDGLISLDDIHANSDEDNEHAQLYDIPFCECG